MLYKAFTAKVLGINEAKIKKTALHILPKQYKNYLIDYIKRMNKQDVQYFVSDMWKPYRQLSESFFKQTAFIADRYCFVR